MGLQSLDSNAGMLLNQRRAPKQKHAFPARLRRDQPPPRVSFTEQLSSLNNQGR